MFLRKKEKETINEELRQLGNSLRKIEEMLNFKVHSDYLNATGNVLSAPWDDLEQPKPCKSKSALPSISVLKTSLHEFLEAECIVRADGVVSFRSFINAFQSYYLRNYDETLFTAIEVRDAMEEIQKEEKYFSIQKESVYRYKGFSLKKDQTVSKSPVQMFLKEKCEFNQNYSIKASDFNNKFGRFCQDNSLPELSASRIKLEMEGLQSAYHFKRVKRSNYMYVGLKVREQET